MQGQNLLAPNGVENPVGELDFDPEQAAVEPVFPANGRGIDEAEAVALLLVACADIRRDARSGEAVNALRRGRHSPFRPCRDW